MNDDALTQLELLTQNGFHGHRLFDRQGEVTTVEYRRWWYVGVADVLLVFGEHSVEAYRVDDRVDNADPFALQQRPQIEAFTEGTVVTVVDEVLAWPAPAARAQESAPR